MIAVVVIQAEKNEANPKWTELLVKWLKAGRRPLCKLIDYC